MVLIRKMSEANPVQLSERGKVVQFPEVVGLHHHYERLAAQYRVL